MGTAASDSLPTGGANEATAGARSGFVTFVAALAAVGGILFGYGTGVISGVVVLVKDRWRLSSGLQEIVVSAVLIGAIIGAAVAGRLADRFGRRHIIMVAAPIFVLGSIGTALAPSTLWLIAGRVIIGVAIGFVSCVVPLYIAEIAPPERRGALVSLNLLAITIGILGSYGVGRALAGVENGWRYMFLCGVAPALVLGIGMLFVPESPRWLVGRGLSEEAHAILSRAMGAGRADAELRDLQESVAGSRSAGLRELLAPWLRQALIIGVGLMFFQQFTGINTVIYYAPSIFQMAGFKSTAAAISASVIVGVVNVLFTILSLWLIDRLGRKPLLYVGLAGMSLSLIVLGVAFAAEAALGASVEWITVGSLVAYVAAFAVSLGPITWLIASEIYPLNVRGTAMGVATLSSHAFNFIIAMSFLSLIDGLGRPATFWLYAGLGLVAIVFTKLYVPETKGVTLEDIERHWRAGGRSADLGRESLV